MTKQTTTKRLQDKTLLRRPGETLRQQIDRVRETRAQAEAARLLKQFVWL